VASELLGGFHRLYQKGNTRAAGSPRGRSGPSFIFDQIIKEQQSGSMHKEQDCKVQKNRCLTKNKFIGHGFCMFPLLHGINETSLHQNTKIPRKGCKALRPMVSALHLYPETCFGNRARRPMRSGRPGFTTHHSLKASIGPPSPSYLDVRCQSLFSNQIHAGKKAPEAPRVPSARYPPTSPTTLRPHSPWHVIQSFTLRLTLSSRNLYYSRSG
jgi:hypothetical protein